MQQWRQQQRHADRQRDRRSGGFNAAVNGTVNPSTTKGGPVIFANSTGPDSTDAGNTYYAFNLNFTRLYATPLTTYKSCTGACGQQVVPALATALGTGTNGNKTWTYHLKPGVKFEDGTPVTSQDVKYAVERTFDRTVLPSGPSYFASLLAGNAAKYPGPFKNRSQNLMGLTSIQTPDPTTIVFQLKQPFADFNYVVAFPQTAPVPPAKDTGTNYQLHPMSTGPYMFQSYQLNKQYTLVPNPQWNPSWDPQVAQHASKITLTSTSTLTTSTTGCWPATSRWTRPEAASRPRPAPGSCPHPRSSRVPMTP